MKYGMDPQEEILKKGELVPWGAHWGEDSLELWGTLSRVGEPSQRVKTEAGDYRGFYQNLRDAILEGKPLAVRPEEALQVIQMIELARQSSERHCRVKFR